MTIHFARLAASCLLLPLLGGCQLTQSAAWPWQQRAPIAHASPVARPAARTVQVAPGDTVYRLSRTHSVSVRAIIDANGLKPPYRLYPGQSLVLPLVAEHVVAAGDTLMGISRRYGIPMNQLARANGLQPPSYLIKVGQRLVLTGGTPADTASAPPPPAAAPQPVAAPTPITPPDAEEMPTLTGSRILMVATSPNAAGDPAPPPSQTQPVSLLSPPPDPAPKVATPAPAPAEPLQPLPEPPRLAGGFDWPARGKLVAKFGSLGKGKHNDGINIELPRGAPVRAAGDGVVAYAGNELRGFGNLLLIKHADGWMSAYAHNDELLVRRGDTVTRGQVVAKVGQSGNVRSPQLHFELRKDANAVDPLKHLPTYKVER